MLKSNPIIAFVATTDPARSKKFYAKTLGLRLVSEDGFALVFDMGGAMLHVATVGKLQPAGYTVLGWTSRTSRRPFGSSSAAGFPFSVIRGWIRTSLRSGLLQVGRRIAWFEDPEGNTLSLTEFASTRKKHR